MRSISESPINSNLTSIQIDEGARGTPLQATPFSGDIHKVFNFIRNTVLNVGRSSKVEPKTGVYSPAHHIMSREALSLEDCSVAVFMATMFKSNNINSPSGMCRVSDDVSEENYRLDLSQEYLDDDGLVEYFDGFNSGDFLGITEVDLSGNMSLSFKALCSIWKQVPHVEKLIVSRCTHMVEGISDIVPLPVFEYLEDLEIFDNVSFAKSLQVFDWISRLPSLKTLRLGLEDVPIGDIGALIDKLNKITTLRKLVLEGCSKEAIKAISNNSVVNEVTIRSSAVNSSDIFPLASIPNLETLYLMTCDNIRPFAISEFHRVRSEKNKPFVDVVYANCKFLGDK